MREFSLQLVTLPLGHKQVVLAPVLPVLTQSPRKKDGVEFNCRFPNSEP